MPLALHIAGDEGLVTQWLFIIYIISSIVAIISDKARGATSEVTNRCAWLLYRQVNSAIMV